MKRTHRALSRIDTNRLQVQSDIPITIFANENVPVESEAVEELLGLLEVQNTAQRFYQRTPNLFSCNPRITHVSLSPDFHKGSGIPIGTSLKTEGFAIPQAVGNDINCGVRLHRTSLQKEDVSERLDELEPRLRHLFFEGGRNIPLTQEQRVELLKNGLPGLLWANPLNEGIWKIIDKQQLEKDLNYTKEAGCLEAANIFGLEDYLQPGVMRDSQIASIGGNNHFVEVQFVEKIHNGSAAHHWGIRLNQIVVMVHSGSVNIGHLCGEYFKRLVRDIYPSGLPHPKNDIFCLPDNSPHFDKFFDALHNASNFAFANRMFLAMLIHQAFQEIIGQHKFELIYDSPHNLAWRDGTGILHRKGSCPAGTYQTENSYFGEPVLVPGSMGSASFLMEGKGNQEALCSASHGAGRALSRGAALHASEEEFEKFLKEFRIITPLDPKRPDVKNRPDIYQKWHDALKKEAPFAYKDVYPIIETLKNAGIATPVAELKPIFTVKGL